MLELFYKNVKTNIGSCDGKSENFSFSFERFDVVYRDIVFAYVFSKICVRQNCKMRPRVTSLRV